MCMYIHRFMCIFMFMYVDARAHVCVCVCMKNHEPVRLLGNRYHAFLWILDPCFYKMLKSNVS